MQVGQSNSKSFNIKNIDAATIASGKDIVLVKKKIKKNLRHIVSALQGHGYKLKTSVDSNIRICEAL